MERQARRNKIKSRETDRMALITGRIQVLDPNIAKSSSFSDNRSESDHLPLHSRSTSEPAPLENDVDLFPDHPRGGDDDDDDDAAARHKKDDDDDDDISDQNESKISQKDASLPPFRLTRVSSELVVSSASKPPRKPLEYHLSSITPKDINSSVISTENTRAICSFVIAFLVVLSQIGLPHKVIKSKSLIAYRPLYALLLSDLLIVAATLALLSQGKESEREVKLEKDVNWDGAVKVLEWGLILHQTVRAVFIDCSLYLAIVICGLSLMH